MNEDKTNLTEAELIILKLYLADMNAHDVCVCDLEEIVK